MKGKLLHSIHDDVQKRNKRIEQLDDKTAELSRKLLENDVKSYETFISNEYFLKTSDPAFCSLSVPQQLMYLSLWYHERGRSMPGSLFSFECQKLMDGFLIDFIVTLRAGKNTYQVAVECDAPPEKVKKLEALGFPVLNFSTSEILERCPALAEEAFTSLENQAEKIVSNEFIESLLH